MTNAVNASPSHQAPHRAFPFEGANRHWTKIQNAIVRITALDDIRGRDLVCDCCFVRRVLGDRAAVQGIDGRCVR